MYPEIISVFMLTIARTAYALSRAGKYSVLRYVPISMSWVFIFDKAYESLSTTFHINPGVGARNF